MLVPRMKHAMKSGSDASNRHFLLITVMFPPCSTLNEATRSLKISEA